MDEIADWRKRIDEIDKKLLELLNQRARYAIEIGKIKSENNMNVYDPEREKSIIAHIRELNKGPLSDDAAQRLFEYLIKESRQIEEK